MVSKMANIFDKATPSIVILILLTNVCFASPLLPLSKNLPRLQRSSPGWYVISKVWALELKKMGVDVCVCGKGGGDARSKLITVMWSERDT